MKGKAIALSGHRLGILAWMSFENLAVAMPVAIETKLPFPFCRKTQDVIILRFMKEISDDNDIVPRPATIPAMEGQHFPLLIEMINLGELPTEATGNTLLIQAQMN